MPPKKFPKTNDGLMDKFVIRRTPTQLPPSTPASTVTHPLILTASTQLSPSTPASTATHASTSTTSSGSFIPSSSLTSYTPTPTSLNLTDAHLNRTNESSKTYKRSYHEIDDANELSESGGLDEDDDLDEASGNDTFTPELEDAANKLILGASQLPGELSVEAAKELEPDENNEDLEDLSSAADRQSVTSNQSRYVPEREPYLQLNLIKKAPAHLRPLIADFARKIHQIDRATSVPTAESEDISDLPEDIQNLWPECHPSIRGKWLITVSCIRAIDPTFGISRLVCPSGSLFAKKMHLLHYPTYNTHPIRKEYAKMHSQWVMQGMQEDQEKHK